MGFSGLFGFTWYPYEPKVHFIPKALWKYMSGYRAFISLLSCTAVIYITWKYYKPALWLYMSTEFVNALRVSLWRCSVAELSHGLDFNWQQSMRCCSRLQTEMPSMCPLDKGHTLQNTAWVSCFVMFLARNHDRAVHKYTFTIQFYFK